MNELANQIIAALRAVGPKGLLIEELSEQLGVDEDHVAALLDELASEGLILQKQELKNEQPLIRAQIGEDADPKSLSDLHGCPCFHCVKISKCGLRQPDSPATCRDFEEWMLLY
jgi:hypothetical protein